MGEGKGLEGITVGIPAARRADETARLVQRWGGNPLVGPTVREVTAADPAPVIDATRRAIDSNLGWSIHLTGVGTKRWFALADEANLLGPLLDKLSSAAIIARGQKAKSALAGVDLKPAWIPSSETSAEIAAWLGPQLDGSQTVAVQLHGEPVPDLNAAIEGTGARLIQIQSYAWELPEDLEPAQRLVTAIVGGQVHALAITSAPQARFLAQIAAGMGLRDPLVEALGRVYLAAVGTVAAQGLAPLGLEPDLIAEPARMGTLIRTLAGSRQAVLAKSGD